LKFKKLNSYVEQFNLGFDLKEPAKAKRTHFQGENKV